MRTAIDCNILSALWSREPGADRVAQHLGSAKHDGALLLSPVAYAESLAHPGQTESLVREFLDGAGMRVDFDLASACWTLAGNRFADYALRRRRSMSGSPRRILADFVIGSHALLQADRLMTLDIAFYRRNFPELTLYAAGV